MKQPRPQSRKPDPDAPAALLRLYEGWGSVSDFHTLLDLTESILLNSYRRPAKWGGLTVASFLAGEGEDPWGVRDSGIGRKAMQVHSKAVAIMRSHACYPLFHRKDNPDVLGLPYAHLIGHPGLGQFTTPFHLSLMSAQIAVTNIEGQLMSRLHQAATLAGLAPWGVGDWSNAPVISYMDKHSAVLMEHYDPVTITEPILGSGSALMAMASLVPLWALAYGAVKFVGADLDPRAVQITKVNCLLYGLPACLHCGYKLDPEIEASIREPYGSTYHAVRLALAEGRYLQANALASRLIGYVPDFQGAEVPSDTAL